MSRHRSFPPALALAAAVLLGVGSAHAAPPSSALTGDAGDLTWTVSEKDGRLHITGRAPTWTVVHEARLDLTPIRTERTDTDGTVVVTYRPDGATVVRRGKTIERRDTNLWDADTLDIRLGALAAAGQPVQAFDAVDPASGKVYGFVTQDLGEENCGNRRCRHVKMTLSGMLKPLGPTWHYWFGGDGTLLRFDGPAGEFAAKEESR